MIYIAVNVTVRQKTDKMHRSVICDAVVFKFAPGGRMENIAAFDGFFNEFRALRINLTASQRVMSYLAVAHIVVGRKSHRRTVRFYVSVRASGKQFVESGGVGFRDGVSETRRRFAHAVHNNQNNLFRHFTSSKFTTRAKSAALSDAPPIRPPSISGIAISSSTFLVFILPPY